MAYIKKYSYKMWSNVENLDVDDLLSQLSTYGKLIKKTAKTSSFQWNSYFVKKTHYPFFEGIFRHLFLSNRCKNSWNISNYLIYHGIYTPLPIAYIEILKFSLPYQHLFVSEYLFENYNVEIFIRDNVYIEKGITLHEFFNTIKKLIIHLWEKGIYHKDLSGKNLLTVNGDKIYLIDLDSTRLINPIDIKYKIRNLTQIYDSFCDFVDEEKLKDFIFSLLYDFQKNEMKKIYFQIQQLQKQRRAQHIKNMCLQQTKKDSDNNGQ